jgi:hypothetical protein
MVMVGVGILLCDRREDARYSYLRKRTATATAAKITV